jgi:aspartyl protease family protein
MLFWPFVVLAFVLVTLFLAGPSTEAVLSGEELHPPLVHAVVLVAGLTLVAAGRVLLRGGPRATRAAAVWLALCAVVLAGYVARTDLAVAYERLRGSMHPSVALATAEGEAELRRAWDGHYRAEAEVNGVRLQLMVDTGASLVLLPYETARAIGIDPQDLDYSVPVTTANGRSTVAPVRLSSIKIGPIAVFDVEAAVAHPEQLSTGLLGMSFLERLSETSFRGDRLILRN